ncbi:MAG: hypothetical protein QXF76_00675 [Candidatus Anstonellales archaeon]
MWNEKNSNKLGYYFSIDLIFAVFAIILLTYAITSLGIKNDTTTELNEMSKKAHQTLAILDRLYILNSNNQTLINETLTKMYQNSTYFWKLEVDIYRNDSSLEKISNYTITNLPGNKKMGEYRSIVVARRIFVGIDKENEIIDSYCLARFYLIK